MDIVIIEKAGGAIKRAPCPTSTGDSKRRFNPQVRASQLNNDIPSPGRMQAESQQPGCGGGGGGIGWTEGED